MEQLAKLLELIGSNGLSIVISAIVIIIVVNNNRKQNKYFDTMFSKLIEQDKTIEEKIPAVHDATEDKKYDNAYKAIYDMLNELREICDSARCYVFMYHNGGQNLNGVPFQRLSCISESTAPGIKPMIMEFQSCQRSIFSGLCAELRKDGHLYIEDLSHITKSHAVLHEMLQERSANSAYFSSVNNYKTNMVIGFIGIEFIEKHTEEEILRIEKLLEDTSIRISGLMEVMNNDTNSQSQ